jgi:hypothetical protein
VRNTSFNHFDFRPVTWRLASGASQVTIGASSASARATYMTSYAVTFSRNFHGARQEIDDAG